jgi:hypothetical protein
MTNRSVVALAAIVPGNGSFHCFKARFMLCCRFLQCRTRQILPLNESSLIHSKVLAGVYVCARMHAVTYNATLHYTEQDCTFTTHLRPCN